MNNLTEAMDAHAEAYGLKVSTIGQASVQNRHAYENARRGTISINVAARILDWIAEDAARRDAKARQENKTAVKVRAGDVTGTLPDLN